MGKKILYFEAPDGISGDMVLGALIDLGADVKTIRQELDKFIQGEYALIPHSFERNGIHGINLEVIVSEKTDDDADGEEAKDKAGGLGDLVHEFNYADESAVESGLGDHVHEYEYFGGGHEPTSYVHRSYKDIRAMILAGRISRASKTYALEIFDVIARAEAAVHRTKLENVQFHEVGAMDSIIDIVGTAIAIDLLGDVDFYVSAVHDGSGTIISRHGIIPVPVPAVLEMAKSADIPIVIDDEVRTEMITPTGFGIIKGLNAKFEPSLGIIPEKTGYGFGKRKTGRLGAVRVTLGEKYEESEEK